MDRADLALRRCRHDGAYWPALAEMNRVLEQLYELPLLTRWPVPDRGSWDPVTFTVFRAAAAELGGDEHVRRVKRTLQMITYEGPEKGYGVFLTPGLRLFISRWDAGGYPELVFQKPTRPPMSPKQQAAIAHRRAAKAAAALAAPVVPEPVETDEGPGELALF